MKYKNKIRKVSRESQLNQAVGVNAIKMADDALKKKLNLFRQKYLDVKEQIQRKYASRARMAARSRK